MNVRVLGRSLKYVIAPEIYYTQELVWISMSRFVQAFHRSVLTRANSYSLYTKHLTRTQFCTGANKHIVIPLSPSQYTLFSKGEDH